MLSEYRANVGDPKYTVRYIISCITRHCNVSELLFRCVRIIYFFYSLAINKRALPIYTCTFVPFPCFRYLKEFRTEQCPLFLQHKCTQHRPFTCFNWHFLNQRRRRPIRRRDGTFNYSPDVYCTKYDETTGICPDGDE